MNQLEKCKHESCKLYKTEIKKSKFVLSPEHNFECSGDHEWFLEIWCRKCNKVFNFSGLSELPKWVTDHLKTIEKA